MGGASADFILEGDERAARLKAGRIIDAAGIVLKPPQKSRGSSAAQVYKLWSSIVWTMEHCTEQYGVHVHTDDTPRPSCEAVVVNHN